MIKPYHGRGYFLMIVITCYFRGNGGVTLCKLNGFAYVVGVLVKRSVASNNCWRLVAMIGT